MALEKLAIETAQALMVAVQHLVLLLLPVVAGVVPMQTALTVPVLMVVLVAAVAKEQALVREVLETRHLQPHHKEILGVVGVQAVLVLVEAAVLDKLVIQRPKHMAV